MGSARAGYERDNARTVSKALRAGLEIGGWHLLQTVHKGKDKISQENEIKSPNRKRKRGERPHDPEKVR